MQGDDYILHCHPMRQKVPKNGMLREWYLTITRACQKQGIVTHTSNLWDSFFAGGNDHKTLASILKMPYLDGQFVLSLSPIYESRHVYLVYIANK